MSSEDKTLSLFVKQHIKLRRTVLSALFIAAGYVLPFLFGQIPSIGKMMLPMHIPVFLCGFLCGPYYGLAVGVILPLTRSLLFGMPAFFPDAVVMAAELAAYGLLAGIFYRVIRLKEEIVRLYASLVLAMLGGRVVWGGVKWAVFGAIGKGFTLKLFLAGGFIKAWPGIILQLILLPPLTAALKRIKWEN